MAPCLTCPRIIFENTSSSKALKSRLIVYFIVEHKLSMKFSNHKKSHFFARFLTKNRRKSLIFCQGLLVRIQLPQPLLT